MTEQTKEDLIHLCGAVAGVLMFLAIPFGIAVFLRYVVWCFKFAFSF